MEPKLYAYVQVLCLKKVRFPYFMKVLHQQGAQENIYLIECYSYAEVDYYRRMCKQLKGWLEFIQVLDPKYGDYRQVVDGGPFGSTEDAGSGFRCTIDGKEFNPDTPLRNSYIAEPFSEGVD